MNLVTSIVVMILMVVISIATPFFKPSHKMADDYATRFDLESAIPKQFGEWEEVEESVGLINPQTSAAISKIYAQTLSRTYKNKLGDTIMLSLAYGDDQSDEVGIHLPEGCYSGQGFKIASQSRVNLEIGQRSIPVTLLMAKRSERLEPITYWLRTGDFVEYPSWHTKWIKMRYAFHGDIPDGLLVRVSSLIRQDDSQEIDRAYNIHKGFLRDLVSSADDTLRNQLLGRFQNN